LSQGGTTAWLAIPAPSEVTTSVLRQLVGSPSMCSPSMQCTIGDHPWREMPPSGIMSEPLVWPIVTKLPAGVRSFVGHANTVLDVIGRIGAPASLVIFTEGNHLMVLSSDDIVGAFPSWARSQPQYANLDLTNIILVTLPQPILLQMVRTGGVAL